MAGYWPSSFFCMFMGRDEVGVHKHTHTHKKEREQGYKGYKGTRGIRVIRVHV